MRIFKGSTRQEGNGTMISNSFLAASELGLSYTVFGRKLEVRLDGVEFSVERG